MKLSLKIQNPWPTALVIFFIFFISYIVGFVVFACRQKMDLVRPDYYDQEIRYQAQIDRVRRSSPVLVQATVDYNSSAGLVAVRLPGSVSTDLSGKVSFYRPSDAKLDRNVPLQLDLSGSQTVSVRAFPAGFWKVRVEWKTDGQEYFFEKSMVIERAASS